MKKIFSTVFSFIILSAPALGVLSADSPKDFKDVINNVFINGMIRPLVPLLIGLAVVVFVYGVLLLVLSEGGEKKEEGKEFMFWGIIGIFVMVSVWGLVSVLKSTFGLDTAAISITIPTK
jgi:hypothetical protein